MLFEYVFRGFLFLEVFWIFKGMKRNVNDFVRYVRMRWSLEFGVWVIGMSELGL